MEPINDHSANLASSQEIWEVRNPMFLSDTFVFCKKHYDDVFLVGTCDITPYIKVNSEGQIEEIGSDFTSRFHFSNYESLLKRSDVHPAQDENKKLFLCIGDEYWLKDVVRKKI